MCFVVSAFSTKLMTMQENPLYHIQIPSKILCRGLPTPLNIPNQTNSRPCRAIQTTSLFSPFLRRTLRLCNNPMHPRPPPPLLHPLQALQTRTPCPHSLLINHVHHPLLTPPPFLSREHKEGYCGGVGCGDSC